MDKEINKIITKLEGCFGIFDYLLTPVENNLLVSYIKKLQQQCKKQKEVINKLNDLLSDEFLEVIDRDTLLDILNEVTNNE